MTPLDWQRITKLTELIYANTPSGYTMEQSRELALKIMKALDL